MQTNVLKVPFLEERMKSGCVGDLTENIGLLVSNNDPISSSIIRNIIGDEKAIEI